MTAKSRNSSKRWVDPDDAPELTEAFFAKSTPLVGGKRVSKREFAEAVVAARGGRPKSQSPKIAVTIRYDADVIEAFKAAGPKWQSRMNSALRKAAGLKRHP